MAANQPILDLLEQYAARKNATKAQISLSWMLHKYPNVVPIPGSKNQERILENLGAWNVALTDSEFAALEAAWQPFPSTATAALWNSRAAAWQTGTGSNDWGPLPGHVCCPGFKIRGTVPVIHIDHRNRPPIILIKLLLVDFGTPGYPRWRYGTCSTQLLLRAYYRR